MHAKKDLEHRAVVCCRVPIPRAVSQLRHAHPSVKHAPATDTPIFLAARLSFGGRPDQSLLASLPPRHALGMALNLVGVAYYTGFWFRGEAFHNLYQIIQASRLIVLWNVLYLLGTTTSGERLCGWMCVLGVRGDVRRSGAAVVNGAAGDLFGRASSRCRNRRGCYRFDACVRAAGRKGGEIERGG